MEKEPGLSAICSSPYKNEYTMRAKRYHDLKVGLCNHTPFFDRRLLMQVEPILEINELQTVTKEVVVSVDCRSQVAFHSESTCSASFQ
jgi:hypothetical protein